MTDEAKPTATETTQNCGKILEIPTTCQLLKEAQTSTKLVNRWIRTREMNNLKFLNAIYSIQQMNF